MMAYLIEVYDSQSAIALAKDYSLFFLEELIAQTVDIRKPESEKDKEQIEEWVEENKNRKIEIDLPGGEKQQINIANFLPVDYEL